MDPRRSAEITLRPDAWRLAVARNHVTAGSPVPIDGADDALVPGNTACSCSLTDAGGQPVGEFGRVTIAEALSPLGEAMLPASASTGQRYVRTADPRFPEN